MTHPDPQQPSDADQDPVLIVEPVHDYYLHVLLRMLEADGDNSISMAFNVNGGLVYGQMISRDSWEKRWIEEVGAASTFAGQVLKEVSRLRGESEDGDKKSLPRFVHLKDAVFVSGSTRQSLGLWRGPLAQIAGWSNTTPAA
ncbi:MULTISPECIES: hypothetical protein [unclassified Streptomyces]|uniref:hypothetical protein n=1 Tax=unclassified Streptomyces TaxID=2593676 RepID=UPI002E36111A|nr:hypothetical protein [Streptomyces sp. NBC_01280]WSE18664.1 hypothetical protein OG518_38085 [Streptomyces sp. NBC_01397]